MDGDADGDAGGGDALSQQQPQQQEAASGSASSSARAKAPVPANVANIRFLCPDGRSRELQFPVSTRIFTIKQELHKTWPAEWKDNQVSTWQQVRLLLRGRFLDDQYTLISLRIPAGQTTVIHLVPRADGLPERSAEAAPPGPTKPAGAASGAGGGSSRGPAPAAAPPSAGCCILL